MRLTATLIAVLCFGVSAIVLSSCDTPKPAADMRAELNKLEGPNVGSIDKTLGSQAEQAVSAGDFRRASQMYQQLVDEHPDNKEYTIALADSLRRSGNSEGALKAINALAAKYPNDAAALEVKGLVLMSVGEFPEASKAFDQVMSTDKKRWRTLNALGIMFAAKNMQSQAIEYYNAALEASPDNPGVLNNLGLSLAMEKQYDKAIEMFMRARGHLESNSTELRHVDLDLALVYALAGRLDDAEQTASPHLVKAELYNNMAFYAYISKNRELAKTYLNMALTQDPSYYERAWKNLNAISGDTASESNADEDNPKAKHVFNEENKASGAASSPPAPAEPVKDTVSQKSLSPAAAVSSPASLPADAKQDNSKNDGSDSQPKDSSNFFNSSAREEKSAPSDVSIVPPAGTSTAVPAAVGDSVPASAAGAQSAPVASSPAFVPPAQPSAPSTPNQ